MTTLACWARSFGLTRAICILLLPGRRRPRSLRRNIKGWRQSGAKEKERVDNCQRQATEQKILPARSSAIRHPLSGKIGTAQPVQSYQRQFTANSPRPGMTSQSPLLSLARI
jgi:hypothetical protein